MSLSGSTDHCEINSSYPSKKDEENCDSDNSRNLPFVYLEEDSIQGIFTQMGVEPQGQKFLPLDWTLKRKARFLSSNSFAWCSRTKGSEDANAVVQATRCLHKSIEPRTNISSASDSIESSWRVELNKLLTYWQQPSMPWLNLFPRFGNLTKICSASVPTIPSCDEVTNAMHDCWVISFRSILQLTRECICPYFYLCGQQYTALFRSCTINGQNDITCTVTPTTAGLRQLLTNEGIEFSRPYGEKRNEGKARETLQDDNSKAPLTDSTTASSDETESKSTAQDDDDSTWDLINQTIKLNGPKEAAKVLHAETSTNNTIFVKGNTNIQLLSNYLMNSKNSITKSGTQANIPPTILAPVAFEGASLKKLTFRSGIARSCSESATGTSKNFAVHSKQAQYSLDITGPLLPHCLLGVHQLLGNTQGTVGYKAALSTSLYSVPFNTSVCLKESSVTPKLETNFGLQHFITEALQQKAQENNPICLNQVVLKNGLYSWNE